MRNPDRIQPFIEKLGQIWLVQPDLRFAQLVELIITYGELPSNVFYVEDDIWDFALDKTLHTLLDKNKQL